MSLCISTTSITGELAQKLRKIARAGFQEIELHEPDFTGYSGTPQDLKSLADGLGLTIKLLKPFHDLEGLNGAERNAAFARLERKFDLMQALGAKMLLLGSSLSLTSEQNTAAVVRDLQEAAARAKKRGIRLAYMALPWGAFVNTDSHALELVKNADCDNLGLALNSCFSLGTGAKPSQLRAIDGTKVFHVQLSDAAFTDQDLRGLRRRSGLLPGQGSLNLAGFIKVLIRNGYQGSWSIARANENAPRAGEKTDAKDGYRALVNLLDEVRRTDPDIVFDIPKLSARVHALGYEFIEFAADEAHGKQLTDLLGSLSFRMERRHISKSVELWRQGAINIVVNTQTEGYAHSAFKSHGPCVCDMGLRVEDAAQTVARATALGAPIFSQPVGTGELDIPAIRGVGANIVHFIDEKSDLHRVWDIEFEPVAKTQARQPSGLRRIDHVAQTMRYDEMQSWLLYYISTFEMAKSRIFDVADPAGVVHSQAIESPDGEVRLNLNGAQGLRTFAGSFLADGLGAGVQHLAFRSDDIFETSAQLERQGFKRLEISPNYYNDLQSLFGLSDDLIADLQAGNILYDKEGEAEYFQIYSQPIFNGFFVEVVERRAGYQGYGARNAAARLAALMTFQAKPD